MDIASSDRPGSAWHPDLRLGEVLRGKRGLVVGIANEHSIAYGCARALRAFGAGLALTWLNHKAEPFVRPLGESLGAEIMLPLDVEQPGQIESVFGRLAAEWGSLDFVVHSIAFAPREDLHGRAIDCSAEGFARAMRISCWSFLRMAKLAEPLLRPGGALVTMSFHGAERVVPQYGLMGPVKAALEASVRYAAAELAPAGLRVFAVSPGPVATRAASGIAGFDDLMRTATERAPLRRLADIDEIGRVVAFLVSDACSGMTGCTIHVDAGMHVMA
jgi:enoyl-[acyl-carrier protein] reductase I